MEFTAPIAHGISGVPLAVADNGVVYTDSWILNRKQYFGLEVQFTTDTDVNVQVDLEESNDRVNWDSPIDTLATVTDELVTLLPIAPVVAVYARLKLTGLYSGLASNSATTVLTKANWVEVES